MFPISFGGARNVDETIVLDGYQIPKNWLAIYNVALTHYHDPTTWQDDGSHMDFQTGFAPERWLDKDTRPTSEFMPFGAGHRFCLGHILAMSEMKTFLSVIARKLKKIDLAMDNGSNDKIQFKEGIIQTPKNGVWVTVQGKESSAATQESTGVPVSDNKISAVNIAEGLVDNESSSAVGKGELGMDIHKKDIGEIEKAISKNVFQDKAVKTKN